MKMGGLLQSSTAAALTLIIMGTTAVLVLPIAPPVTGTVALCNTNEYSAADGSIAGEINRVVYQLGITDPETLPELDLNLYSPHKDSAIAFGKRECLIKDDDVLAVPKCLACFKDADLLLVNGCQSYHKVGGQVTLDDVCTMRYEIYDFITPSRGNPS